MLSSCAPEFYCKRCPTTTIHTIEIRDTIFIKETLKDTTITIYLPADSVCTVHKVVCESVGMAQMQQVEIRLRNMVAKMQIENGQLTHNLVQIMDSLDVTITYKEREITNLKSKVEKLEQLKPERYVPKIVRWLAWTGGVSLALLFVFLGLKLRKLLTKFPFRM
jgi:hypothetical protein